MDQRIIMGLAGAAALVLALVYMLSPSSTPTPTVSSSANSEAQLAALMSPGPLPEITAGKKDAKVKIVEYASMSCPACAYFHNNVYPEIKKAYIDTGKVYFVFREFPLNDVAVAASMLTRCVPESATKDLVEVLFKRQRDWLVSGDAREKLFQVVKQAGFTQKRFDDCLADNKLRGNIVKIRERADKQFNVRSTPSFFINGKPLTGRSDLKGLSAAIDAALK